MPYTTLRVCLEELEQRGARVVASEQHLRWLFGRPFPQRPAWALELAERHNIAFHAARIVEQDLMGNSCILVVGSELLDGEYRLFEIVE